jgi:PPIC-type PPIASE domain
MGCWWLIFTLFLSLAMGRLPAHAQAPAASPKPSDQTGASATTPQMASHTPVITVDGICGSDLASMTKPLSASKPAGSPGPKGTIPQRTKNSATASKGSCQTIITRAQFERLAGVVAPNRPPQSAIQLAHFYSTQLLYAHKAHELGLDKDPKFDEILRFTYLQVLARAFTNHLQQEADAKAAAEFDQEYKQHPEEFEQVQVLQISVPKKKHYSDPSGAPVPAPANVDTAADAAALKAEAEKIRSRAVAGEDFEKLENEVYTFAGDPDDAPDTDMGENTRAEMQPFAKEVFALQPGQISEVLSGTEAWHIFKVVSKQMMPADEARKRIAGKLMKEEMDSVNNSVKPEFNERYFVSAGSETANPSGDDTQ